MTTKQILVCARVGQFLTALVLLIVVMNAINPMLLALNDAKKIMIFLIGITAPLCGTFYLIREYKPANGNFLLVNWENASYFGIFGTLVLSVIYVSNFVGVKPIGNMLPIQIILILLVSLLQYKFVQMWIQAMTQRGKLE
ncbi:MAG: hypothetical protein WCO65_03785 [bacterium]